MYQINSWQQVALKILLASNFLASYEKMIAMNTFVTYLCDIEMVATKSYC